MVVQIAKTSLPGKCLVCHCDLGFFRRLMKNRFCTGEHEQQYMAELREVALGRLRSAGSRLACQDKARV
jgi:hypothetical protein